MDHFELLVRNYARRCLFNELAYIYTIPGMEVAATDALANHVSGLGEDEARSFIGTLLQHLIGPYRRLVCKRLCGRFNLKFSIYHVLLYTEPLEGVGYLNDKLRESRVDVEDAIREILQTAHRERLLSNIEVIATDFKDLSSELAQICLDTYDDDDAPPTPRRPIGKLDEERLKNTRLIGFRRT